MAINGSAVLLKINTGTTMSPTWTVIPCQTTGDYSLSVATRDTSCKDSADDTNAPGARSRTMSVETLPSAWPLLSDTPTGALQILRSAAETGQQIEGRITVAGDDVEQFTATMTSVSISAPREDNVTMSIDLAISGGMTPVDES